MDVARYPAQEAYSAAASQIAEALKGGEDVVVLCEGDPLFYGSFMYLFARLSDQFEVEIVPGVTSVTACAAALQRPLSARNEVLTIIPGTLDEEELAERIAGADALAIMKVGRHLPKIKRVLAKQGLVDVAGYVERASLPNERLCPLAEAPDKAPYFSMILVTKGGDPWLS
jgi:precorrin-2/cobalt-factor-2 C20-methyltransferase